MIMEKILKGNAVIGQSGGPTAAINATLSGVIRGAFEASCIEKIFGMRNGIEGLLGERLVALDDLAADEEGLKILEQTPAAALGSCRKKLPDPHSTEPKDIAVFEKIFEVFEKNDIRYLFYIGGNDSMDTVAKLSEYSKKNQYEIRLIGVPKTIDNDLVGTDHTPGFGSAAKFIATTVREIVRDCSVYTQRSVTIVEIMGRDAGWLTASSAIGRIVDGCAPDYVYLPECPFDEELFFNNIEKSFKEKSGVVIAVSEGLQFADGRYVGEGSQSGSVDVFGHKYLSGTGKVLENMVRERLGCKVRSVELNLPQRCAGHLISLTDIEESVRIGKAAVVAASQGESGVMMTFVRDGSVNYNCNVEPKSVLEIANKTKYVPQEYLTENKDNVTDDCCKYLLPLICGECDLKYSQGLPIHIAI